MACSSRTGNSLNSKNEDHDQKSNGHNSLDIDAKERVGEEPIHEEMFEMPSQMRNMHAVSINGARQSRVRRVSMNNGKVQLQDKDSDDEDDEFSAPTEPRGRREDEHENNTGEYLISSNINYTRGQTPFSAKKRSRNNGQWR